MTEHTSYNTQYSPVVKMIVGLGECECLPGVDLLEAEVVVDDGRASGQDGAELGLVESGRHGRGEDMDDHDVGGVDVDDDAVHRLPAAPVDIESPTIGRRIGDPLARPDAGG